MNEAKEYLQRIKWYDKHIDGKAQQIAMLEDQLARITPVMNDIGGSGGGNADKMGDAIARLVDLRDEMNAEIRACTELKREANALLNQIRKPEYYTVLNGRYLLYKTYEQIAAEIPCSVKWARVLHKRALNVFEAILKKNSSENEKTVP